MRVGQKVCSFGWDIFKETQNMKYLLAFIILLASLLPMASFADGTKKILLISDIDDTIKASHVLDKASMVGRVGNITVRFSGMAQLYQLIVNENPSSTKIIYLSNAPKDIVGIPALQYIHQTFLSYNRFPPGAVDLRENIFEQNHKIKELRRVISAEKPDVVIMVGDNGEQDAEIYRQASVDFQKLPIKMVSFIHQIYSVRPGIISQLLSTNYFSEIGKKLEKDQVGFVTPVEIALELNQRGLLNDERKNWMIKNVLPYIVNENYFSSDLYGTITFPAYMNCSDFVWHWPVTAEIVPLVKKINSACK